MSIALCALLTFAGTLCPAAAQDADRICTEMQQTVPGRPDPTLDISHGRIVLAAPVDLVSNDLNRCQLARWYEPAGTPDLPMLLLIRNQAADGHFTSAKVEVQVQGVGRVAGSRRIDIGPSSSGVFMFVGPIDSIMMYGKFRERDVIFARRALPSGCRKHKLLDALKVIDPSQFLAGALRQVSADDEVQIVRVQFDETIVPQGNQTTPVTVRLDEDRNKAAYIDCYQ
ncbi:MAG: hypothetical protein AAF968_08320 [Pseudomonadota bacterium]